jgi:hypothetical protein
MGPERLRHLDALAAREIAIPNALVLVDFRSEADPEHTRGNVSG